MSFAISYAQNREDFLIQAFFPDIQRGFYIDVGAFDPTRDSVTKLFYDTGWRGINVEPAASQYALFTKKRPRDINLNIGIGAQTGEMRFRNYISPNGPGMSTFAPSMKRTYKTKSGTNPNALKYEDTLVKIKTLADIWIEYNIEHAHFLKIDVEGFEYEVLEGMDWQRNRPELICIEVNHVTKDWRPILAAHGYSQVFFDGLNNYYLAHESRYRNELFQYPERMLTGPQIIKWTVNDELQHIVRPLKAKNTRLQRQVNELQEQLKQQRNENKATDQ